MQRRIRVTGQGISESLAYTGRYEDSPEFGVLDLDRTLDIIKSLPPFTKEADEEGLCPPAIILFDETRKESLIIYSSTLGFQKYNVDLSRQEEGMESVAESASFDQVASIVEQFFLGNRVVGEKIERKAQKEKDEKKLLVVIPCRKWIGDDEGFANITVRFWEDPSGYRYVEVEYTAEFEKSTAEIPLSSVTKIILKKGSFLRSPGVELGYIDPNGKKRKIKLDISKEWRDIIDKVALELEQLLPGKVYVK